MLFVVLAGNVGSCVVCVVVGCCVNGVVVVVVGCVGGSGVGCLCVHGFVCYCVCSLALLLLLFLRSLLDLLDMRVCLLVCVCLLLRYLLF